MLHKVCPIIYHRVELDGKSVNMKTFQLPHKGTPLLYKYLSVTQKEELVSPAGIKFIFCRSHLPFCASQNMLCLAPAVPRCHTL